MSELRHALFRMSLGMRHALIASTLLLLLGGTVSFNNTFAYDEGTDTWSWHMDNMKDGKPVPFGRVRLTRP